MVGNVVFTHVGGRNYRISRVVVSISEERLKMKRLFLTILVGLMLTIVGCGSANDNSKVSICVGSNISYVQDDGTVYCVRAGQPAITLGENVKDVVGEWDELILLCNDGTVMIYDPYTGDKLTSEYCYDKAINSPGTGDRVMAAYADVCAFFEENKKVDDIIFYSPDVFMAKVNGEWIGPACEWFLDVDFNQARKFVGSNPNEPDFLLNDDGSIICLSGYYHDVKGLLGDDKKYKDVDESFETFFLGEDSKIYAQKDTVALDWENVEQISVYAYNVVGVDKAGNVLLENETSRHYEEVSTWKDVIYVEYAGDFIIGVDKAGNILATKEAVERFSLDLENLPKVRVSR